MIAEEYRVGGTCVIRGCVPKKLLVYASRFAREFEDAAGYGWTVPEPVFDWPTLIANKDQEIARLEGAYTATLEAPASTIVKARAVIADAHTVQLANGERGHARTHPDRDRRPRRATATALPGIEHVISSNEAFHLPELPKRMVIQGGGYIAVEFAGIFTRAGQRGDAGLSRREHPARLRRRRARQHLHSGHGESRHQDHHRLKTVAAIEKADARLRRGAIRATSRRSADLVMFATGRKPNVAKPRPREASA